MLRTRSMFALAVLFSLAASSSRADVYVADVPQDGSAPSIHVFSSNAIGDAAPIRTIAGPATELVAPFAITVDTVNAEIYVSDFFGSAVLVYPLAADGNVAPIRKLVDGPNSLLRWPRQLVVDTVNDEIIVPSFNIFDPPPAPTSSLRVYPRTANGDVAPIRSVYGDSTNLDNPINLVLDLAHGELITDSYAAGGGGNAGLVTYARTADGDVPPTRAIAGGSTMFGGYTNYLAFDPGADELYADAFSGGGYAVFPRTANGDVAPTRSVSGIETNISVVKGIAYDATNARVVVISFDEHDETLPPSLNAFARDADGDVVPEITISGPSTQLVFPSAIAFDLDGGFARVGAHVYKENGDFDDAFNDPGSLTVEDFEGGSAAAGEVLICDEPVDAASDDGCFTPGTLVGGFSVRSSSGAGVAAVGPDFFGNASTALGAVFIGDATIVSFGHGTTAFAMDVYLYDGGSTGRVDVFLHAEDGSVLGYAHVKPETGTTRAFLGVIAPQPVARVELRATSGGAFFDNLRFNASDPLFADGFELPTR
ncbi:MAG: hypothetical protein ABW186_18870 [Rhodanobacteraceae bacterium]